MITKSRFNSMMAKARSMVNALLATVGQPVTVTTVGGETQTAKGFIDEKEKFNRETAEISITTTIYVGNMSSRPSPGDVIDIKGRSFTITSVKEIDDGKTAIFYELGVDQ